MRRSVLRRMQSQTAAADRPVRRRRLRVRALACLALVGTAGGCELREIALADAADVIVAEFNLVAGADVQTGILHRTRGTGVATEPVVASSIAVTSDDGSTYRFDTRPASFCLFDEVDETGATCYASESETAPGSWVLAGRTYTLRVELTDGRVLTGVTTVPDAFTILRPGTSVCALAPGQPLEVVWQRSAGAWVYAAETELLGLRAALAPLDIYVPSDPLRLFGLAVSNTDTTIVFPTEFGVFDRFDEELTETLAAIQGGLPPNVGAEVVIAAADRNYVNWERGGAFNPSGFVRVPSVFGDGTGVFGSIVPRSFTLDTASRPDLPAC
jgi:hypothetical protein